ncbi:MAG TPA: hypothetical protein VHV78_10975, partial [Gemmatimonadaceae bacterium]|nr:hypothetical protein [Gemmatimonadaceae bacterium]
YIGYTSDLVAGIWMGFDRPQKIKANAQGGILAAPVWAAFMNEVYSRRQQPADWPMPFGIVAKQIDVTTNMLATAYCPPSVVANEFFISGTEPVEPCTVHTGALAPDSVGGAAGTVVPPVQDSTKPNSAGVTVPGVASPLRTARPTPDTSQLFPDSARRMRDTSRRSRDSAIFVVPPRRPPPPKPDTGRLKNF